MSTLRRFQDRIGYIFQDEKLLRFAMTHPSAYAKRSKEFERMEFLGDRVLGLVIAEWLLQEYPKENEGDLAKRQAVLVSRKICDQISLTIDVKDALQFSLSDFVESSSVLADTMEALIAAIYLDGGLESARKFIRTFWKELLRQDLRPPRDPKTVLQEWAQARDLSLPKYTEVARTGPDHAPVFAVEVSLSNGMMARGEGASKRLAERDAAELLMGKIKKKK